FIPVERDRLLQGLIDGTGDVAAGNITVTPERQELVDFTDPIASDVKDVVVTGPGAPQLASLDDLAGKKLVVRGSSSYFEHLKALNDSLVAKGLQPIVLEPANEGLESEDLLEMVNAGLVPITVVDRYLANF
ncbi:MAG: transporter substrate-binding domain-containing protein, partial [Dongiaceae bacterium]